VTAGGALALLGLGARAGRLAFGTTGVQAALRRGTVALVVLAADRSQRTRDKVERLATARGVPVVTGPDAAALGAAVGRAPLMAVGITDPHLAAGYRARALRTGGKRGE
jgi:ribosomal protein L7Ae-like RNA K-turn-binding protein